MKNGTNFLFSLVHPRIKKLLEVNHQMADIEAVSELLGWDQQTYMPSGAAETRGEQMATLAGLSHKLLTSKKTGNLLDALSKDTKRGGFTTHDQALIRESRRAYDRNVRVPQKTVEDLAKATSLGDRCWRQARKESDFTLFRDALTKIFNLKLQEAESMGCGDNPYDLFLDDHEPGLTAAKLDPIFAELKETTLQVLECIRKANRKIEQEMLKRKLDEKGLREFNAEILQAMGFDFNCGRLDISTHPFSTGIHPTDTRITTRFGEQFFTSSIFSVIHEAGHALYEQGVDKRLARTLLCGGASLGIHESQSRLWENYIGRSAHFWSQFYKTLISIFPDSLLPSEEKYFVLAINAVEPNLIRVDSDEVTYNLHIILRFEIERDLFAGRLKIADLPEAWNTKIKEYLGLTVPDDARGVLQDIHWSSGAFGYFPTYSLGNLYAAQIYETAKRELGCLEERIGLGEMHFLREWLREKIHRHGQTYRAEKLINMATGEALNPAYFKEYLFGKFGQIYGF